jgi:hypothetical protein
LTRPYLEDGVVLRALVPEEKLLDERDAVLVGWVQVPEISHGCKIEVHTKYASLSGKSSFSL